MADPNKAWTKKETSQYSGVFDTQPAPKEPDYNSVDPTQGAYGAIDADIAAQQKANLADPSRAAALEKMVIARRKYLGKQ